MYISASLVLYLQAITCSRRKKNPKKQQLFSHFLYFLNNDISHCCPLIGSPVQLSPTVPISLSPNQWRWTVYSKGKVRLNIIILEGRTVVQSAVLEQYKLKTHSHSERGQTTLCCRGIQWWQAQMSFLVCLSCTSVEHICDQMAAADALQREGECRLPGWPVP